MTVNDRNESQTVSIYVYQAFARRLNNTLFFFIVSSVNCSTSDRGIVTRMIVSLLSLLFLSSLVVSVLTVVFISPASSV